MDSFAKLVTGSGLPRRLIAEELGVCERTIRRYEIGETKPKARNISIAGALKKNTLKRPTEPL